MYKKNKRTNRTKIVFINRIHKLQVGNTDIREKKLLQRWNIYFRELFHGEREKTDNTEK